MLLLYWILDILESMLRYSGSHLLPLTRWPSCWAAVRECLFSSHWPQNGGILTPTAPCCHPPREQRAVLVTCWSPNSGSMKQAPCWALLTSEREAQGWIEIQGSSGGECSAPYWALWPHRYNGEERATTVITPLPPTHYSVLLTPVGNQGSALTGSHSYQQGGGVQTPFSLQDVIQSHCWAMG